MLMIDRIAEHTTTNENDPLQSEVRKAMCWGYDVTGLDDPTGHRPLSFIGHLALTQLGCVRRLNLDDRKLRSFLTAIEYSMPDGNMYHNRVHVAGVVQHMYAQLVNVGVDDPIEACACIVAAIIHDTMHPGMSADKWREIDPEALPQGVSLEQYHLDSALRLMSHPANNFLHATPPETIERLHSLVSELVLATDMSKHAQLMKDICSSATENQSERRPIWMLRLFMKVADLHHCLGSTGAHVGWVKKLCSEMNGQRTEKLSPEFARGQLHFFDKVVLPMVDTLAAVCPATAPATRLARANRDCWIKDATLYPSRTQPVSSWP